MKRKINVAQWLMDAVTSSLPSWICRDEDDKFPLECGPQSRCPECPYWDSELKQCMTPRYTMRQWAQLVDKVQSNSFNGSLRSFYLEDKNNVEDPFT